MMNHHAYKIVKNCKTFIARDDIEYRYVPSDLKMLVALNCEPLILPHQQKEFIIQYKAVNVSQRRFHGSRQILKGVFQLFSRFVADHLSSVTKNVAEQA